MPQRYHPYDPADPKPATMYPAETGAYVKWEDYFELLKASYAKGLEVWKAVVSTDVYQDLKHDKFRDIMTLLADGEISVGKAAQSIVERAGGIEPRLPEYDASQWVDDKSWKERYEALKLLAFDAKIDIAYALKVGYKAEDCGDHCHVECYWCQLRESLKKLEDAGI